MFDYDEESRNAVITLDKYDLAIYLKACVENHVTDSWDVREYIMEVSNTEVAAAIEGLTIDEFQMYLSKRYGAFWIDEVRYMMRFRSADIHKEDI